MLATLALAVTLPDARLHRPTSSRGEPVRRGKGEAHLPIRGFSDWPAHRAAHVAQAVIAAPAWRFQQVTHAATHVSNVQVFASFVAQSRPMRPCAKLVGTFKASDPRAGDAHPIAIKLARCELNVPDDDCEATVVKIVRASDAHKRANRKCIAHVKPRRCWFACWLVQSCPMVSAAMLARWRRCARASIEGET